MKGKILTAAVLCAGYLLCAQNRPHWQTWDRGPDWLDSAVIYQVYPSSFKDSDNDGIGDIRGAIGKLDYIASLGVDAVWFNPLFESTWLDGGYDVTDFYKVDSRFGTNDDLVELISEAHSRGLKVLLDLVAGHTSYKHPWFLQSAQGTNLRYSDYYIWTDSLPDAKAAEDLAEMMSSAEPLKNTKGAWMQSDCPRARYYNKNFYATQPALNYGYAHPHPERPWEQPFDAPGPKTVRQELRNILSFWFDKGVDGFRVDMAASLIKDDDAHFTYAKELWREVRAWMDREYPGHILMAEWGGPKDCLAAGFNVDMDLTGIGSPTRRMYQDNKKQADGGCYFSLDGGKPSTMSLYGEAWPDDRIDNGTSAQDMLYGWMKRTESEFDATRSLGRYATITGNHDQMRMNIGGRNNPQQLKVMMSWILTMPLPIIYYGEEIGMRSLADLPSVEGSNHNGHERSGARTPMQWEEGETAGFSDCAPENLYLPVCTHWTPATSWPLYLKWKADGAVNPTAQGSITVSSQENDPSSMLNFTRKLIRFRKNHRAFHADGIWRPIYTDGTPYPMVYLREGEDGTYLVALNPTGKTRKLTLSHIAGKTGTLAPEILEGKASYKASAKSDTISMGPTSVLIVKL